MSAVPMKVNNEAATERSENAFCQVKIVIGINNSEKIIEAIGVNFCLLYFSSTNIVIKNNMLKRTAKEAVNPPNSRKWIAKHSLFNVFKTTIKLFFFAKYAAE